MSKETQKNRKDYFESMNEKGLLAVDLGTKAKIRNFDDYTFTQKFLINYITDIYNCNAGVYKKMKEAPLHLNFFQKKFLEKCKNARGLYSDLQKKAKSESKKISELKLTAKELKGFADLNEIKRFAGYLRTGAVKAGGVFGKADVLAVARYLLLNNHKFCIEVTIDNKFDLVFKIVDHIDGLIEGKK